MDESGDRLRSALTLEEKRGSPFRDQRAAWRTLHRLVAKDRRTLAAGGGKQALRRQHERGRLTARERVRLLIDEGAELDELMAYAGWGLYQEHGGAPGGGVVAGIGPIGGRDWMVIANDATVKAGAFFPITAKKVIRAQTVAMENRLPTVYLVDSAGVYLPLQDEIFPDQDDFGRVFYLNARMSAAGIPQLAAIMGNCVAGGAYLPVMCDALVMTEGSGLYLAGPALVRAAIGQRVDSDELGGGEMHSEVSGTVDYLEADDRSAIARLRRLAGNYAPAQQAPWACARVQPRPPCEPEADLEGLVPAEGGGRPYEVREVIARLVDGSQFQEYKARYGKTLVCGHARLGGYTVGIVANQRKVVRSRGKLEVGGVIYGDAADKAARFILDCNHAGVPLLFIHDVSGFMVGRESEQQGIIRRGAKMVNAVSNSVVPRLALIIGGSYGAGHYAMSGRAYAPRFLFAWPSARYAVMGGQQAAKTILDIQAAQLRRRGEEADQQTLDELYRRIEADYEDALDIRYGAARLWVDEVILPAETRRRLIRALEACACNPDVPELKTGVFQV